jgi:hypothetical protein
MPDDHADRRQPVDEPHGELHRRLAFRKLDEAAAGGNVDVALIRRDVETAAHENLLAFVAQRVRRVHA